MCTAHADTPLLLLLLVENDMREKQAHLLGSWDKDDLSSSSLIHRLHDLTQLEILYPDKSKEEVFGNYTPPCELQDWFQNDVCRSLCFHSATEIRDGFQDPPLLPVGGHM